MIVDLGKVHGGCWASPYKEMRRPATILSMSSIYDTADDVSSRGISIVPRVLSRQWEPFEGQLDSHFVRGYCSGEASFAWC
jgi:hypothetical protein